MANIAELLAQPPALRRDAEVLLCHSLGVERGHLYAWPEREVAEPALGRFRHLLARRREGVPVAYLFGRREFWGLSLAVDRRCLVPRPETELLVEWALELPLPPDARVADWGTGSGAIALALASERPGWGVLGADIDPDALALARHNGDSLGVTNVRWEVSGWGAAAGTVSNQVEGANVAAEQGGVGDGVAGAGNVAAAGAGGEAASVVAGASGGEGAVANGAAGCGRLHLLVSNPPYIAEDAPQLATPELRCEPRRALVSGPEGLDDLTRIIAEAPAHLRPGGWLLLEHGWDQGGAVRGLLAAAGFESVRTRRDLAGLERATGGVWRDEMQTGGQIGVQAGGQAGEQSVEQTGGQAGARLDGQIGEQVEGQAGKQCSGRASGQPKAQGA